MRSEDYLLTSGDWRAVRGATRSSAPSGGPDAGAARCPLGFSGSGGALLPEPIPLSLAQPGARVYLLRVPAGADARAGGLVPGTTVTVLDAANGRLILRMGGQVFAVDGESAGQITVLPGDLVAMAGGAMATSLAGNSEVTR